MLWNEMSTDGYYRRAAQQLRSGDVALDIGANIGLSAMMFADTCPGVTVIAAEPAPMTYDCLARNAAAHVANCVPLCTAVGAERGMRQFTWYPRASANSGFYADRSADDEATRIFLRNSGLADEAIELITDGLHEGETMDVEVMTVSDILTAHASGSEVGVLKVDVERAELEVLRGITETDWPRIRSVVAEVHDTDGRLAEFCGVLRSHGLEPVTRQDPSLSGTELHEVIATRAL